MYEQCMSQGSNSLFDSTTILKMALLITTLLIMTILITINTGDINCNDIIDIINTCNITNTFFSTVISIIYKYNQL